MIKPTVGRVVLFYPDLSFPSAGEIGQPLAATIAFVHSDTCVNLCVVDANGVTCPQTSVFLRQDDAIAPENVRYCEWMPFQKGQAERAEQLESHITRLEAEAIEQEIVRKGLTAPRVTKARIDELLGRITYTFDVRPNGSTTTLAHAFLDGDFYLATGMSACVSGENFNAEMGKKMATSNAMTAAEDKLWELEGYALRGRLSEAVRN